MRAAVQATLADSGRRRPDATQTWPQHVSGQRELAGTGLAGDVHVFLTLGKCSGVL